MRRLTKSRLFFLELLVNILFFCVCASICVMVFSRAYTVNAESSLLSDAVQSTQKVAESYKAAHGDLAEVEEILAEGDAIVHRFDPQLTYMEDDSAKMRIELQCDFRDEYLAVATVSAVRLEDTTVLYELSVTTLTEVNSDAR